jgi:hypothetical protein
MRRNLINLFIACGLLLVVMGCFCRSERDGDQPGLQVQTEDPTSSDENKPSGSKRKDEGDFIAEHIDVTSQRYMEIDKQIRDEKLLEKAADKLNRALALPHDITLRTKNCNQINALYDSSDKSVTICYELMEHFYNTFRSDGDAERKAYDRMFDAVRFVFLHEIAHALIDTYNLPITGNEEDAADRCAAFINLTELGEEGVNAVFAATRAFYIESKQNASSRKDLADEHLLQEQRFYNSLCMIYGSNTTKYANIVNDGMLPKERAVKCPTEYQRTVESWKVLLDPWRMN